MDSIEEKRVFGDRAGAVQAYVASSIGVVRVHIAGETVGEFSLCARCDARDIATTQSGRVVVATDEDVRIEAHLDRTDTDDRNAASEFSLTDTGFGPATAVGVTETTLLAARPDGSIAVREYEPSDDPRETQRDSDWEELEFERGGPEALDSHPTTIRAIDGDLLATDAGVYRLRETAGAWVLEHAGLTDVVDVSAGAVPLAATADGLYRLGNGWMKVLEGTVETVTADPQAEPGRLSRAHAVRTTGAATAANTAETAAETASAETTEADLYAFEDETWEQVPVEPVDESIVDVGYGPRATAEKEAATTLESVYAVTESGTVLVSTTESGASTTPDAWRQRSVGVTGVTGLVVRPE
ncbi:uncharacterized protein Nmag_1741 [Natrialba magadii ATCC 43099]|uniref:HVO-0234-like beta-propeller domain-containing protein n=1 Tax=Natrialba magadii (strain ATCC 43099 / DSM 3394 / CCM 3739 / CIP 104546 / IAM 13178 / JCM 8861 / NBRC 102185 / NCIMB 2190 / MS3) TaxID=547559 RepID=D3SUQ7_NATMM|nr:hypothetical protein [Natrialba magadii]ADD05315.1 uncharacterized protein Nmag_1741 [Natrialba magadii ATCC 43099]ELY29136.1 hypothetical protein C500_11640 [Natrialba magadii ATCC 43099]